jgi:hypothetical protein
MSSDWREVRRRATELVASLPKGLLRPPSPPRTGGFPDDILPFELYRGTRQNIERIADQINQSFFVGVYDGCAVLMRRLMEMLLVLAFKEHNLDHKILGADGNHVQLSDMVDIAAQDSTLDFTRNAREYFGIFREKGNLSAHNPFHTCRRRDLELAQPKFRHLVEELLYKAKILS